MKKFNFRLEPLLNYRRYLERLEQQKTASAQMDVKNSELQIQSLNNTRAENSNNMDAAVEKGVSASVFRQYYQYSESLDAGIRQEKERKILLEKKLQEQVLELKKKSVDKKAMELYREKLMDAYRLEAQKEEQKEQDENTSLKVARTLSDESAQ